MKNGPAELCTVYPLKNDKYCIFLLFDSHVAEFHNLSSVESRQARSCVNHDESVPYISNFVRKISRRTQSNTLLKSKKRPTVKSLISMFCIKAFSISANAVSDDLRGWKTHCWLLMIFGAKETKEAHASLVFSTLEKEIGGNEICR